MSSKKETSKLIDDIFEVLNKAKFDNMDGNDIIKFGNTFRRLAKFQADLNKSEKEEEDVSNS